MDHGERSSSRRLWTDADTVTSRRPLGHLCEDICSEIPSGCDVERMMGPVVKQSVGRTVIWFFRVLGPVLLASLLVERLLAAPVDGVFQFVAGPLYLVAWVGSYLAFLEYGRTRRVFALPFSLIVLAILLLAGAAMAASFQEALPTSAQSYLGDAARIVHGIAAVAITVIGWTTPIPRRR